MEQSFTKELLLEIYDEFNRSARVSDDEIHPELLSINSTIQSRRKALKNFRVKNSHYKRYPTSVQRLHDVLQSNLRRKYSEKRAIVNEVLTDLASRIRSRDFRVHFSKIHVKGKDAYSCGGDAASRYCLKAISRHMREIYKLRPASRDYINHQLTNYLQDNFPYRIIRADISSFFESIPHDDLICRITDSGLLSAHSQTIIRRLLNDYAISSGGSAPHKGVPRGLSLSSDLAEYYMRDFDRRIKNLPGVVFYSRYVDDILAIVAHDHATASDDLSGALAEVCQDHKLTLNPNPAKHTNKIWNNASSSNFTYLGFEHKIQNGKVITDISHDRHTRYKLRIDRCFEAYRCRGKIKEKSAGKWLVRRLKFLTTNTRLEFSKELAHTGIYYNNAILSTPSKQLNNLDAYLRRKVTNFSAANPHMINLNAQLQSIGFTKGFSERTYSSYTASKGGLRAAMLKEMTGIWKND